MAASTSPLLSEWLSLLKEQDVQPGALSNPGPINANDTLIVIDMQHDFLPGGSFGVAEGDQTVAPIAELIAKFQAAGSTVIASRDYHPNDHCSFAPNGGVFSPHCVQGTKGAEFNDDIAAALQQGMSDEPNKVRTHIVYKGFSKDIDSFGAVAYPEDEVAKGERLTKNDKGKYCASCWTGSFVLKASNINSTVNAPPDVMAILDKKTIDTVLPKPGAEQKSSRIFVVGLALDYCVHDTALNATKFGYQNVQIIVDCARATHETYGKFGTGFLSNPETVCQQLRDAKVTLTTKDQLTF